VHAGRRRTSSVIAPKSAVKLKGKKGLEKWKERTPVIKSEQKISFHFRRKTHSDAKQRGIRRRGKIPRNRSQSYIKNTLRKKAWNIGFKDAMAKNERGSI